MTLDPLSHSRSQGWAPLSPYSFLQAITQSSLAHILPQPTRSCLCIPWAPPTAPHLSPPINLPLSLQIWPHPTPLHPSYGFPSLLRMKGKTRVWLSRLSTTWPLLLPTLLSFHSLHPAHPLLSAPATLDCFVSLSLSALILFGSSLPSMCSHHASSPLPAGQLLHTSDLNWDNTASTRPSPTPEMRYIIFAACSLSPWCVPFPNIPRTGICWFNALFSTSLWNSWVQGTSLSQCPQCLVQSLAHKWWPVNFS